MSKNSGVPGKTIPQLLRSQAAAQRQGERDSRTTAEQFALLGARPGRSAKEHARLAARA